MEKENKNNENSSLKEKIKSSTDKVKEKFNQKKEENNKKEEKELTCEDKIKELEKEIIELKTDKLRALADFDNYRKRKEQEMADARDRAISNALEQINYRWFQQLISDICDQ